MKVALVQLFCQVGACFFSSISRERTVFEGSATTRPETANLSESSGDEPSPTRAVHFDGGDDKIACAEEDVLSQFLA